MGRTSATSGRKRAGCGIHHQFGAEAFGVAEPEQDVECILLQMDFYRRCGVKDLELQINSLGDRESKTRYRDALVAFLTPRQAQLSEDSQRRLDDQPASDSRQQRPARSGGGPRRAAAGESLSEKSRKHFDRVQELLRDAGARLSRQSEPRARISTTTPKRSGKSPPAGLGAERHRRRRDATTASSSSSAESRRPASDSAAASNDCCLRWRARVLISAKAAGHLIWLVAHGDAARAANWKLMGELRAAGLMADMDVAGRSVKAQFKIADREGAAFCVTTGETELQNNTVIVKDLAERKETTLARDSVHSHLRQAVGLG